MIGGCDGFTSRSEPGNPNIVYTSCQSGGIARLDQRTGENKQIRPGGANVIPNPNDPPAPAAPPPDAAGAGAGGRGGGRGGGGGERTNWDAPYIISPFSPTRLYWGSTRVYRSDDRGDHWMPISPDLSRNLDPRVIPIMGKIWDPIETVAYNNATTPLSNIVSIDESPLMEGLIYAGTDDGLVQVTEDGGKTWRRTDKFGSFPDGIYVTSVRASPRDANVVFATLNNWQRGDFKPYVVRSEDRGKTFTSITGDLPTRMDAFSIVQDHVNSNLLFVGAEFGLFFTVDGGQHWVQLKGGLPTIQVRDLAIQKRENDLVLGTFGRGFYVLDDYSALRDVTPEALGRDAELFPLRRVYGFDELTYIQAAWGNYTTPNPPNGATFTYHVGPSNAGNLVLTIADEGGKDLCRMDIPETDGVHRVTWNLRVTQPAQAGGRGGRRWWWRWWRTGSRRPARVCADLVGRRRQRGGAASRRWPGRSWRRLRWPRRRRAHGGVRPVHGHARSSQRRPGDRRRQASELPGGTAAGQELVSRHWAIGQYPNSPMLRTVCPPAASSWVCMPTPWLPAS